MLQSLSIGWIWMMVTMGFAGTVRAQTPPPIKPGLWHIQSERELDGKKMPDPADQFRNLPPQARQQMEAMLKQRGVETSGGGGIKICQTKETLSKQDWQQTTPTQCKTEVTSQTPQRWSWESVCSAPMASTSKGETIFQSSEAYTANVKTVSDRGGKTQTMTMRMAGRWIGADCGDVKPILAPKR